MSLWENYFAAISVEQLTFISMHALDIHVAEEDARRYVSTRDEIEAYTFRFSDEQQYVI